MDITRIDIRISVKNDCMHEEDLIELSNDIEGLELADKIRNVIQNLLNEHDLDDKVTLKVSE